ncbi:aldehyde dehydrogenase (NADP(+)) [Pseudoalteromonas luteoviolacea]|uniref:aldehyde dehydrogenase (NADP(+)) n=1 Tax=Pseudoalteromonas luteoviolacea TaxID=43657 RepID=UPI001B374512|nr:aldehyde dehydrogenase (NADP(+)) [Pseudoalteromonas luteoviolacea]MBQ4811215.1 aldehyde dehydrogenase (NADP(+)) [Pseudoalteromonas luteoviolacea]
MAITGLSYIAGQWLGNEDGKTFQSFCPGTNEQLPTTFYDATEAQLEQAAEAAQAAFKPYRNLSNQQRAEFLNSIAQEILDLGDILIETTMQETNLPRQRLEGERMRTVSQLRAFANALEQDLAPLNLSYVDEADASRAPLPKPRTELSHIPVGVVAVFGASNFPYAFSTLGGDTAAALAAGCPVIVKTHNAHPATSELMTKAIDSAIKKCNMPDGVFSMLQAKAYSISHQLVSHPVVKAVGFTGSFNVANALIETINKREEAIPFYGELGSVNPQVIFKDKASLAGPALAQQLVASLLMGNGQFCTSPGVWFVPAGQAEFEDAAIEAIKAASSDTLLTPGILKSFISAIAGFESNSNVTKLAKGKLEKPYHADAHLFACDVETFLADKHLQEEVFGPCALIVRYNSDESLVKAIDSLAGQLTASVHGTEQELTHHAELINDLHYKVGRITLGQMPTGVEICASMNHGGPFPSSTDVRSTSVGLQAMTRFLRPLCIQS